MRLDGEVGVVTGGNSGIGLAISKEFSAEGAQVAILGRDQASLDEATRAIGDSCLAVRGDVTAIADLDRLYAATQAHWGSGIDVLVANAGVGKLVALEEYGRRDVRLDIQHQLERGVFHRTAGDSASKFRWIRGFNGIACTATGRGRLLGVLRHEGRGPFDGPHVLGRAGAARREG